MLCMGHILISFIRQSSLLFSHIWIQIMTDYCSCFTQYHSSDVICGPRAGNHSLCYLYVEHLSTWLRGSVPYPPVSNFPLVIKDLREFAERCSQTTLFSLENSIFFSVSLHLQFALENEGGLLCSLLILAQVGVSTRQPGLCKFAFHAPLLSQTYCFLLYFAFSKRKEHIYHILNICISVFKF